MSTLTTRIAGYSFTVKTLEEGKFLGQFFAESGDGMDLPYELRSAYECAQMLPILIAATDAVTTLTERTEDSALWHSFGNFSCKCDNCRIHNAMEARQYAARKPAPESYVDVTYSRRTGRHV